MKIRNCDIVKSLLVCIMVLVPCVSVASWKDYACAKLTGCDVLSNNYTRPICVTNFNERVLNTSDVNHSNCIITTLTNSLSSDASHETPLGNFTLGDVIQNYCLSLLKNSDS